MSRTINKVELSGQGWDRSGDAATRPNGTAVTKLRLATDRYRRDAENETDWHDVVVWGATAEAVNQYVGTGQRVYVAGRLVQNSWEDRRRPAPPPHRDSRLRGRVPRLQGRERQRHRRRLGHRGAGQRLSLLVPQPNSDALLKGATTGPSPSTGVGPALVSNPTTEGGRRDNEHNHVAGHWGARPFIGGHSPDHPRPAAHRSAGVVASRPRRPAAVPAAPRGRCRRPSSTDYWSWRSGVPSGPPW